METTRRIWSANNLACISGSPSRGGFSVEIVDDRPGIVTIKATGPGAESTFGEESGGHRWQRVPPNEKRGRVHTSTVTVAVLPDVSDAVVHVAESDIEWQACRGSGAGGQNRNKVNSAVQLWHRKSGIYVRCESERSQWQNRQTAMEMLRAKLWAARSGSAAATTANARREQVGSGMRGDKRRTIRMQDDQVVDHVTGKRWRLRDYLRGEW